MLDHPFPGIPQDFSGTTCKTVSSPSMAPMAHIAAWTRVRGSRWHHSRPSNYLELEIIPAVYYINGLNHQQFAKITLPSWWLNQPNWKIFIPTANLDARCYPRTTFSDRGMNRFLKMVPDQIGKLKATD